MEFIYWQNDLNKTIIVRQDLGTFEQYYKGQGWVENPERFDIVAGVDPFYTVITEEAALQAVAHIEADETDAAALANKETES